MAFKKDGFSCVTLSMSERIIVYMNSSADGEREIAVSEAGGCLSPTNEMRR